MTIAKATAALAMLGALAACGGSGGGTLTNDFDDQAASFATSFAAVQGKDPTDLVDLPVSGSATYDGNIAIVTGSQAALQPGTIGSRDVSDADLIGELNMNVNFLDRTVRGVTGNYVDGSGSPLAGTIAMNRANLTNPTGDAAYQGTLSGTLTAADGTFYEVRGGAGQSFYRGSLYNGDGNVAGVASAALRSNATGVEAMVGTFVGDKD